MAKRRKSEEPKEKENPLLRKIPLEDALSEAFGELSSLAEEMRSWADNLEEKFSQTEKYQRVSDAAELLEGHTDAPDVPDSLKDVEVEFTDLKPKRRGHSRAARCGQACYILDRCIEVLTEIGEGVEGDRADEAKELADELDNPKGECEGVEFPGMFG